ncbi:hypothetical protein INR49_020682 [Caranx melampygus]|nr:hypothetical protein INR49_020682 [Caranx melampygus]
METSDDGSSPQATINNTDGSSPCHHHHHHHDPVSPADVINTSGPGVTCLGEPIRSSSAVSKTGDNQGVGSNTGDDVTITSCAYRSSPHVETNRSSDSVASCSEGSKVNLHHRMEGLCGGGAMRSTDPHLCAPTPALPSQVKVNPVNLTSDSSQEEGVTSDLLEVGTNDETFISEPPLPGHMTPHTTAPRSRNTFKSGHRQSTPGDLVQGESSEPELQSRRPGIIEYFSSRGRGSATHTVAGWKLFGKVPLRQSPCKQARIIQQEFEARSSPTHHATGQQSRRNLEFEPLSTTALILEDRPPNLPAKSAEETQRHRQQYEQMVAEAKRRELKESQRRQQQMKEKVRQEEEISNATLVWNQFILPHWDSMKSSRRAQDLWWGGLPPSVRGRVWSLAISNELNITTELYEIFLLRAKERWSIEGTQTDNVASLSDGESGQEQISRDVSRTFPSLCVFQQGGPYHDLLQSILGAYTCYRPDVGYVQGMSSIAAVLILNMDEVDAFITFSNLMNKPCQLAFYRGDQPLMFRYFGAFQLVLENTLPHLFLYFQSVVVKKTEEEEPEGAGPEEEGPEEEEEDEGALQSEAELSSEQREELRAQKIRQKKLLIAALGSAIVSDPISNMKRLKELRAMLMESDPSVAVTVRKLVMVSLMEIFKDIAPTYRIRPLTPAEKAVKVKKETQQLREFEEGLVSQYKFYLEDLEQTVRDWKQKKRKRSQAVGLQSYGGLAQVAVRCLCELLLALPHFNFHNNIVVVLVPLMNDPSRQVSDMCCDAFKKLFQQDREGGASLAVVRVISGLIKSLNYNVRPEVLRTLLSLRIKEVEVKKDIEATAPKKKFMNNKEKKKNLSRMQRKWKKAEEKLEKELLEAEASESKEKKIKLHTETLNIVFLIYFRILKKAQKSVLLPAVLEGLANFAHLINLEFFDDLLNVLQNLIRSRDLTNRESLHCIQTVFTILSGQGDVLNIDPLTFYTELYRMLLHLHAVSTSCPTPVWASSPPTEPSCTHYHPVVRQFASHLCQGAPSEGAGSLGVELSRRCPVELFGNYSVRDMTFNPPVALPITKKKDRFGGGASLLDAELQRQVDRVLTATQSVLIKVGSLLLVAFSCSHHSEQSVGLSVVLVLRETSLCDPPQHLE